MTTNEKCREILLSILELCNHPDNFKKKLDGPIVSFSPDWGGYSLTVEVNGCHSHAGLSGDDGSLEMLVDNLHGMLCEGHGLSWVKND